MSKKKDKKPQSSTPTVDESAASAGTPVAEELSQDNEENLQRQVQNTLSEMSLIKEQLKKLDALKLLENLKPMQKDLVVMKQQMAEMVTMKQHMEEIHTNLKSLKEEFCLVKARVYDMEVKVKTAEEVRERQIENLTNRIDTLEQERRKNHLCVLGLPQIAAKTHEDVLKFFMGFFEEIIPNAEFTGLDIERIRRIHIPKAEGESKTMYILQFANSTVRDSILFNFRDAAKQKPILWGQKKMKISIFPDFTRKTAAKRRSFKIAKDLANGLKLRNYIKFPATFCVLTNGTTRSFFNAAAAEEFLRNLKDQNRSYETY